MTLKQVQHCHDAKRRQRLRLRGSDFRSQHVGELPFSFFFPKRLRNPRLAEGQNWQAAVDENFLLVYKPGFEPNKKYTIVLTTDPVR